MLKWYVKSYLNFVLNIKMGIKLKGLSRQISLSFAKGNQKL